MGSDKASLAWGEGTLAGHVTAVVRAAVDGPVVVVRARGQQVAGLPDGVVVVDDPVDGEGPVRGLLTGLEAVQGRAEVAFVAATDLPLLDAAVVRRVLTLLAESAAEVALPVVRGYPQPLAAAYRVSAAATLARRLAEGERRLSSVVASLDVRLLTVAELIADPRAGDIEAVVRCFTNVNEPQEYARVRDGRTR